MSQLSKLPLKSSILKFIIMHVLGRKGRRLKYGILADDFTGAGDVGLQFRRSGFKVTIITKLDVSLAVEAVKGAGAIVLDTETRNASGGEAYKTVRRAVEIMKESRVELAYKKIDSTLRGNIGSELDAVLDATIKKLSLVAPALPEAQRATVGGYHLVRWTPIEQTEFAKDPLKPVKESNLVKLISLE
ncbi:TPA: four-carbon acid sugar kinase family protein, partial [Candidatus Bathyarchaeota archaeon]|nr:four-carbon acid sugar kinase family protein [Candidatus Bathyarchaeota archaeon]